MVRWSCGWLAARPSGTTETLRYWLGYFVSALHPQHLQDGAIHIRAGLPRVVLDHEQQQTVDPLHPPDLHPDDRLARVRVRPRVEALERIVAGRRIDGEQVERDLIERRVAEGGRLVRVLAFTVAQARQDERGVPDARATAPNSLGRPDSGAIDGGNAD